MNKNTITPPINNASSKNKKIKTKFTKIIPTASVEKYEKLFLSNIPVEKMNTNEDMIVAVNFSQQRNNIPVTIRFDIKKAIKPNVSKASML